MALLVHFSGRPTKEKPLIYAMFRFSLCESWLGKVPFVGSGGCCLRGLIAFAVRPWISRRASVTRLRSLQVFLARPLRKKTQSVHVS